MNREFNIEHDNLIIRQTISDAGKNIEVLRKEEGYNEILSPYDDDFKRGVIALHNYKLENNIW